MPDSKVSGPSFANSCAEMRARIEYQASQNLTEKELSEISQL
ncbi:hypothetical protein [Rhizobium sp. SL42]|nr:hypothetical protein [Rhizobium sp. SL42]